MIKQFFFKRSLRRRKERGLFELGMDLKYIETFKSTMLLYDDSKARVRMAELKKKGESMTDIEEQELDQILNVIAESKAVKGEHRKTASVMGDINNYISLL